MVQEQAGRVVAAKDEQREALAGSRSQAGLPSGRRKGAARLAVPAKDAASGVESGELE